MLLSKIKDRIGNLEGRFGIYYLDINSGEDCYVGNTDRFISAGILKFQVLIEVFRQLEDKIIGKNDIYVLKDEDKVTSIGALSNIHEGIRLTIEDLYKVMIAVSDNTACNVLIKILGMDNINKTMDDLGFANTKVNRLLYDYESRERGLENYYSLKEMAEAFIRLYEGQLISKQASNEILTILKFQQRSYIMPYYFGENIEIAHQVGEDEGIIHDLGIIYAENPFVLCMGADGVDTRKTESVMRDIAYICYKNSTDTTKCSESRT